MSDKNFVDYVKICGRSGHGGAGSAHLHRDKRTNKGGPDGGDGGRGGHIILRGNAQRWTLLHLKYMKHVIAGNGEPGGKSRSTGADGEDIILEVPLGTVAKNAETDEILFEINHHDETKILVKGGRGGLGNFHFRSSTNQTPRYAQPGEPGLEIWNILELKVLADVGLVGFPNAGKSTLLSAITAAKPKIGAYPFTTLVPNLGIVSYRDARSFIMADIPGIIEDAHKGKGLGIRFLKHIERNAVLLFMIPIDAKDIMEEYRILLNELAHFNSELLDKRRLLAITKSDVVDEETRLLIDQELNIDIPYLFISSITGYNLEVLKDKLWELMND
ncbi:MAG TPA: GTPase ObgE [Saprospiraceae bacterium]|nr:GTPase ObgE [Saprospiraceae bacterium]MCB9328185.1 GTPase ObgE [Lewinellaceae bacterium]HRX29865.1 GTPase ObgE [Saprospiraceae bacterium]